jgi:hypothetical protein
MYDMILIGRGAKRFLACIGGLSAKRLEFLRGLLSSSRCSKIMSLY